MPKYKSPDGRMFDCIYSAKSHFCDQYSLFECEYLCQLNRKRNQKKMICYKFVTKYPIEAARLMGYEIIEDEQADVQEAKADSGKPRPSLVQPALIRADMATREFGCAKYHDPDNWRNVEAARYWDALLRHVLAAWDDWRATDPESGLPHLHHIICNAGFLAQYMEEEQDGKDNQE